MFGSYNLEFALAFVLLICIICLAALTYAVRIIRSKPKEIEAASHQAVSCREQSVQVDGLDTADGELYSAYDLEEFTASLRHALAEYEQSRQRSRWYEHLQIIRQLQTFINDSLDPPPPAPDLTDGGDELIEPQQVQQVHQQQQQPRSLPRHRQDDLDALLDRACPVHPGPRLVLRYSVHNAGEAGQLQPHHSLENYSTMDTGYATDLSSMETVDSIPVSDQVDGDASVEPTVPRPYISLQAQRQQAAEESQLHRRPARSPVAVFEETFDSLKSAVTSKLRRFRKRNKQK